MSFLRKFEQIWVEVKVFRYRCPNCCGVVSLLVFAWSHLSFVSVVHRCCVKMRLVKLVIVIVIVIIVFKSLLKPPGPPTPAPAVMTKRQNKANDDKVTHRKICHELIYSFQI